MQIKKQEIYNISIFHYSVLIFRKQIAEKRVKHFTTNCYTHLTNFLHEKHLFLTSKQATCRDSFHVRPPVLKVSVSAYFTLPPLPLTPCHPHSLSHPPPNKHTGGRGTVYSLILPTTQPANSGGGNERETGEGKRLVLWGGVHFKSYNDNLEVWGKWNVLIR